ncbi:MAG: chitobiase/beta-hexosaminidase C-terminal domain-containing protein [Saprospiraceae bacterium]|nr:chitobiase/beta-hexosaminidase C-terminal domain-containing protein [Saprospiraceae bacterium]
MNKSIFIAAMLFGLSTFLIWQCTPGNQIDENAYPLADHLVARDSGFQVETVKRGDGEWLSITKDPLGRLLVSPRRGVLLRFDLSGGTDSLEIDSLDVGVYDCQGLLCAYGNLYMMGQTADTIRGIYRLKDLDGQGNYGEPVLMKEFEKNGDHSGHTLAVGPEGKIYFLTGNVNYPPLDSSVTFVNRTWKTDHLSPLPLLYGRDQVPPGGFVMRTDSMGEEWEFFAYGLRNPYDMCFSPEGELFTFDSDMEWDFNLPWYRPTRVNHLVSGGDYAWRPGVAKRFDYFPDIWPSVVDFGRGSPTATCFGTGTNFPAEYQKSLFVGDWSYGKIYRVALTPQGSSYTGEYEIFVTGQPLNITDMVVGDDGSLYFTTGGNGTDTGLFRIRYKGENDGKSESMQEEFSDLRDLRHQIEQFHFAEDSSGLQIALSNISHSDRFIRNASRVILERNDPGLWISNLQEESSPDGRVAMLTALIRSDSTDTYQELIFNQLKGIDYAQSSDEGKLGLLRLYGLAFLRARKIPVNQARDLYEKLLPFYPSDNDVINKELSRLLAYLSPYQNDPQDFIAKTFDLLETTKEQLQFIHYLEVLRQVPRGWTIAQRLAYRHWIQFAKDNFNGGSLFKYFLTVIEDDFDKHLTPSEKRLMAAGTPGPITPGYEGPVKPKPKASYTALFDNSANTFWQFEDLQYNLELVASPRSKNLRDFNRGQKMFAKGQCYDCHYMINKGGNFGPDLTTAGNSFAVEELLKNILNPSEVINSRYQGMEYKLKDGTTKIGRPIEEDRKTVHLQIGFDPANQIEIDKDDIESSRDATVSEMPPGLLNTMSRAQILDLLYFIIEVPGKDVDSLEMDILEDKEVFLKGDSTLVEMVNYADRGTIYYTLDGSEPSVNASAYSNPFYLSQSTVIKAKVIDTNASGDLVREGLPAVRSVHAVDTAVNGMYWTYFKDIETAFDIKSLGKPFSKGISYVFAVNDIVDEENNVMVLHEGYLKINTAGKYTFYMVQDDRAQLFLDDQLVIDGSKGRRPPVMTGEIDLSEGLHKMFVPFYDLYADEYLSIEMEGPDLPRQIIPADLIFRDKPMM